MRDLADISTLILTQRIHATLDRAKDIAVFVTCGLKPTNERVIRTWFPTNIILAFNPLICATDKS